MICDAAKWVNSGDYPEIELDRHAARGDTSKRPLSNHRALP